MISNNSNYSFKQNMVFFLYCEEIFFLAHRSSLDALSVHYNAVFINLRAILELLIQGTLIIIGLSSLIGVPIGVMSGIYLSEYGDNKLARTIRFFNDVFMEFPSIVLGIFAFLVIVLLLGHFSVWAGAFALSLIMFPIVARTTEEPLKMVPAGLYRTPLVVYDS